MYELLDKPDLWKSELREIQESLKLLSQDVSRKNGSLYKKVSKVWIPYVKPSLRTSLIVEAHCLVGHSGVQKTMAYLNFKYYREVMNADVLEVIHSCIECAKEKPRKGKIYYKSILPKLAFHTVIIDVVVLFKKVPQNLGI